MHFKIGLDSGHWTPSYMYMYMYVHDSYTCTEHHFQFTNKITHYQLVSAPKQVFIS